MLSRLVITFLPKSKHLLISWLQSPFAGRAVTECKFTYLTHHEVSQQQNGLWSRDRFIAGLHKENWGLMPPPNPELFKEFQTLQRKQNSFFFFFFFPVPGGLLDPSSPTRDRTWLETVKAWSPSEWTVGIPSAKHFFKTRRGQSLAVCCKSLGVGILCSCRSGHLFL